jgi:hypothetical protein
MMMIECPDCGHKIEIQGHEDCVDCPECDTLIILGYEGDTGDTPGQKFYQELRAKQTDDDSPATGGSERT